MTVRPFVALPHLLVVVVVVSILFTHAYATAAVPATAPAAPTTNPWKRRTPPPPIVGRWDLTVRTDAGEEKPSWIEVEQSGYRTLVGRYVGVSGSARPVAKVDFDDESGKFSFAVPPQWERTFSDVVVEGILDDGGGGGSAMTGTVTDVKGNKLAWTGRRAPALSREVAPTWGEPKEIFNGKDLSGWHVRWEKKPNGWRVIDGVLSNAKPGNDLVSDALYDDFRLVAEFRYPTKSNSGIYLRGRYEVQIEDTAGRQPDSHHAGGVYGFLLPNADAAKPAGEWQTMEIELVGRTVSVTLNGRKIIREQIIPGVTGGALDSAEDKPGPVMIQGDHGPIEFRKLLITPAAKG